MNPVYSDEYCRSILGSVVPESSPRKYISPNGSPQVTPTKYRPDGGDRYIPFREDEKEWTKKYSKLDMSVLTDSRVKTSSSAKRNLNAMMRVADQQAGGGGGIGAYGGGGGGGAAVSHNIHQAAGTPTHNNNTPAQYHIPPATTSNAGNPRSAPDDSYHDLLTHRALLSNELLDESIVDIRSENSGGTGVKILRRQPPGPIYRFSNRTPVKHGFASSSTLFSTSPLSSDSQRLLKSPRKPQRKVPKNPYKVLDAPDLQDDFYLNLVDWSSQNILSVGLNTCVYLWSAYNSQVVKLCDLGHDQDAVTSVQWAERGEYLAVGTNRGKLEIWDAQAQKKIHSFDSHNGRIGCLAWNNDLICSGSRDRSISVRDLREMTNIDRKLTNHRQEVCGLKWSPNKQYLASGGNDNQLLVWNLNRPEPVHTYTEHNAAVKALAWSPHHHGVLVSGGGTADRCLRFWNTLTNQLIHCVDTGSQVCNVAWSKHSSELVSTHGYSYNHIVLWKYPQMRAVAHLQGHSHRVLYLAMSPCGESIVTGAGDETLRFWHVFSKSGEQRATRSPLDLHSAIR
jgi:cell division cycle 20-like protein 1 (cofactor of APC complex)